jgi:hypothetical protein
VILLTWSEQLPAPDRGTPSAADAATRCFQEGRRWALHYRCVEPGTHPTQYTLKEERGGERVGPRPCQQIPTTDSITSPPRYPEGIVSWCNWCWDRAAILVCSERRFWVRPIPHVRLTGFFWQAYGEAGVIKIIRILEREIVHGMQLLGASGVQDLVPEMVSPLVACPIRREKRD